MQPQQFYIRSVQKTQQENGQYPFSIPAIARMDRLDFTAPVTFFVGENGMGKSTLLEAIATGYGFNPEGGSKNFNFSTRDSHSELYRALTITKGTKLPKDGYFLRAESFYNLASQIDAMDEDGDPLDRSYPPLHFSYGGRSLHRQSHGESFLALIHQRLYGGGLYLFDEPESALSPTAQFSILQRMKQLVAQDSQFIIATHSPILLAYPGAVIYAFDENGIQKTRYEHTAHYALYKRFLNDPDFISQLMDQKAD